jgi:DNA-binding transcriptional ArsR family regulator
MPVQVIETNDPLADLVKFRTSAVYEMLVSMTALMVPHRFTEWTQDARQKLGADLYRTLETTLQPYHEGALFIEFATACDDHDDVPRFIEFVRTLPPEAFAFWMFGRVFSREEIAMTGLDPAEIRKMLRSLSDDLYFMYKMPLEWIEDIPAFQNHICDLWQTYWDEFFAEQIEELRHHWMSGLREKEMVFQRDGGVALFEHLTGKADLPPNHPPDMDLAEIVFVPIYFTAKRVFLFYGYGNLTVLFDSQLSESRVQQIEQARSAALSAIKAMSDENRLKILRLIVLSSGTMSGKKLAEKLCLSPSAVSRHLAQLREGNLISEQSEDNRTITYTLNKEVILSLPDAIMDYLYS